MALISPILDDRTYEQLREELVRRIPVYTPEWTNHNESDPGIALLELFAYLGEAVLFRFNQIPDATKVAFLRLLGVAPRTARPGDTPWSPTNTELPAGVPIPARQRGQGGRGLVLGPSRCAGVAARHVWPRARPARPRRPPAPRTTAATTPGAGWSWGPWRRRRSTTPRWSLPIPLAQDAKPLDVTSTVDQKLWIALLRKEKTDLSKLSGRGVFFGISFDAPVAPDFDLLKLKDPSNPEDADTYGSDLLADPPPMLWRLWNGPPAKAGDDDTFTNLEVGSDTTRGLTATGVVEILLPERLPGIGDPLDPRLGARESPPPLPDEKQAEKVVAWLQASRPVVDHVNDVIGKVSWVGINVVEVQQSRKATPELLGIGTGDTDQRYPLAHNPVLPGTVQLQVQERDDWVPWREVEPYAVTRPNDLTFTLDAASGSISFTGYRVPQPGQQIRVLTYDYSAGLAGNVAAGAISEFPTVSGLKDVGNRIPAAGGADPARLTDALKEIPATVHRRERAVIAEDFSDFAREVDGVGARGDAAAAAPRYADHRCQGRGQRCGVPARSTSTTRTRQNPTSRFCAASPATSTSGVWSPPRCT